MVAKEYASVPGLRRRIYAPFSEVIGWIERRPYAFLLLLLPSFLFMMFCFVLPMLLLLRESFFVEGDAARSFTLAQYAHFLGSAHYRGVLWNSMRLALYVTLVALVIGYPLAYGMARLGGRWRAVILVAVVSPLMVSVVIRTFGWQILLRNSGPINTTLLSLGLIDEPLMLLFSPAGVVIGLVHAYLPFMVLPLAAAIERINPALEEASRTLGASAFQLFRTVILPLSLPGIGAGAALVFTASISAYVIPMLLGGERVQVMPTLVTQQVLVLLDWSFGAAIATILTMVTLIILVIYGIVAARFFQRYRIEAK
ncbi:ABC transporter permease [Aquamicrobium ahrensii]|uniref:Spermidine/putrescine transport system permease protein n=1 Tax=Aquamicrobium ahrensii TaxID=469551 RepID=A0ABV2KJB8_9HYPH